MNEPLTQKSTLLQDIHNGVYVEINIQSKGNLWFTQDPKRRHSTASNHLCGEDIQLQFGEMVEGDTDTTHMLKDTYDFVNKISTLDSNVSRYQVSFDVESLFTNVPTKETIDIILVMVYTGELL